MIDSIIYAVLAVLGLGFLVFIHELGHYYAALASGMEVEVFSIGFGRPLYAWTRRGVKWQLCLLPFGGYVKIAGMQREGGKEPHEIPNGFYGKGPLPRIFVALAGPAVNFAFAFAAFGALWLSGGREKPFSEFTHRIGWVDPTSALYSKGVRPGDLILEYDGRPFTGFRDLILTSLMDDERTQIRGIKLDEETGVSTPFDYTLDTYRDPRSERDRFLTIGVMVPARMFIAAEGGGEFAYASGLQPGDRLLWIDGEVPYSAPHLSSIVNQSTALLTVERDERLFLTKVPRVQLQELRTTPADRAEIGDWQHEAGLKGKVQELYFIPYRLSQGAVVEGRLAFIDQADQEKAWEGCVRCRHSAVLQEDDRIVAVDGLPIHTAYDLLETLQTRRVLAIVQRPAAPAAALLPWTEADRSFDQFNRDDLTALIGAIGTSQPLDQKGDLHLLKPIMPRTLGQLPLPSEQRARIAEEYAASHQQIAEIQDPAKREEALRALEQTQKKLLLGIPFRDEILIYNPHPVQQLAEALRETARTLASLFTGSLNPKYMSGPIGIVRVVHQSWTIGAKEALFWLGLISLNLAIFNLLPIPVLDGGHIALSLFEWITRRRLPSRAVEKLIIPFVVLLVTLFLYISYQDIVRLLGRFL
jgi:regulator of sigma E protease